MKSSGTVLLLSLLGLSTVLPGCDQAVSRKPIIALAWNIDELNKDKPQIVSPYRNITMFYWLNTKNIGDVAQAKQCLDQQPEGRRAIFDWDVYRMMYQDDADKLTTADGQKFSAYWWDHGLAEVEKKYDDFFREYKEMGGKLDYYILDSEHSPGSEIFTPAHWAAVEKDPRFADILKDMHVQSSADLRTHRPVAYWSYLHYRGYRYYDRLYEVVKKYYPNVRCSDYGAYYNKLHNYMAWGVWDHSREVPGQYGNLVGTDQALPLYGVITHLGDIEVDGRKFGLGPFRSLMYACNDMRAAVLSSDVPVMPWIAWRGYVSDFVKKKNPPPYSSFGNTDYYQESVYHAALCDPGNFLVWSAFRWQEQQDPKDWAQAEDMRLLDALLDRINAWVGYSDRATLVRELSPWHAPYLLTGMKANGKSVWRLTPDPQQSAVELDQIKTCDDPLTFVLGDVTLVMPGGKIDTPDKPLSSVGYWITGPADLKPVVTQRPSAKP
ncbi:MAG: hypothetical protein ACYC26_14430 [Phycisphaerales bacterium]